MAINTSACFVLVGMALLFLSFGRRWSQRPFAVAIIGSVVVGQSLLVFSGYFTGVPSYTWGTLTQMAMHTAAGFSVLGVGLIAVALRDELAKRTAPPRRPRARELHPL